MKTRPDGQNGGTPRLENTGVRGNCILIGLFLTKKADLPRTCYQMNEMSEYLFWGKAQKVATDALDELFGLKVN